jgi:hypothetical protein
MNTSEQSFILLQRILNLGLQLLVALLYLVHLLLVSLRLLLQLLILLLTSGLDIGRQLLHRPL